MTDAVSSDAVSTSHHADRRRELMERIGEDSVAIFTANPHPIRSNDTRFPYRPSSDILYLTGFREPETVVVLAPGRDEGEFVMFVRDRDEDAERWAGRRAGPAGVEAEWGADEGHAIGEIDEVVPEILAGRETLYYTLGQDGEFDEKVTGWINDLRHRRGEPPGAPEALVDARDVIHEMRLCKRPEEKEVMREANQITMEAHELAMRYCRPGIAEYQLEALIEFHFRRNGAEFPAYPTIVGSGNNATILHYTDNRDVLRRGEMVLIDAGCEYGDYAGDITRSYPVDGHFSSPQRKVYQSVLEAQIAAIEDVEPGLPFDKLQERTVERLTRSLVEFGVLAGDVDELIEEEAYKDYYPHKVGHWLGIDVHDVGMYREREGDWKELEPGMVVTIEPGLYFPEDDEEVPEPLRGIGVRIEDDVMVTETGYENLSKGCPKRIDEVEELVGSADAPVESVLME